MSHNDQALLDLMKYGNEPDKYPRFDEVKATICRSVVHYVYITKDKLYANAVKIFDDAKSTNDGL